MNAAQAQALYQAEKNNIPQIYGQNRFRRARCAMGVLEDANLDRGEILKRDISSCPLCGTNMRGDRPRMTITHEADLIVHLNDVHKMTFSEIARKLGPDSV